MGFLHHLGRVFFLPHPIQLFYQHDLLKILSFFYIILYKYVVFLLQHVQVVILYHFTHLYFFQYHPVHVFSSSPYTSLSHTARVFHVGPFTFDLITDLCDLEYVQVVEKLAGKVSSGVQFYQAPQKCS